MKYFRQFLIVGGMPEVVATFLSNKDFASTIQIQKNILDSYRDDISKYAGKDKNSAKQVFDNIPMQLAKENKRFTLASIEEGASNRKYGDAVQWLVDAGIAYFAYNVRSFDLPFSLAERNNLYKLYLLDTGLLCCMTMQNIQFQILKGDIDINEGAFAENFVASELVKNKHQLFYYDQKSKHELDFLLGLNGGTSVIEVKSGKSYQRHASLEYALQNYGEKINQALVLCRGNVECKDKITYLPLYDAFLI
ncbi:MAG: DUF4143 domain-containing protein [Bacteroidales bacterium]|nr:DUF4143 domain-containing protein [Bacteroidales bacterium]